MTPYVGMASMGAGGRDWCALNARPALEFGFEATRSADGGEPAVHGLLLRFARRAGTGGADSTGPTRPPRRAVRVRGTRPPRIASSASRRANPVARYRPSPRRRPRVEDGRSSREYPLVGPWRTARQEGELGPRGHGGANRLRGRNVVASRASASQRSRKQKPAALMRLRVARVKRRNSRHRTRML